ncbi:MAG: hypothetical protein ACK4GT_12480 [Pararhodobacter sp.]
MASDSRFTPREGGDAKEGPDTLILKGRIMLKSLQEERQSESGRALEMSGKVLNESLKLLKMSKLNPKGQAIVITAVSIRKAMHVAGITTTDEAMKCMIAVSKLGSTLALAGAMAPTGPGMLIPLVVAALEGYEVGKACFVHNGNVSHAVTISGPK